MTASRSVIVAGAGIGGLTAALALARSGFRVTVLEQAERLAETGAGIQLSPNATRCLIELGLGARLKPHVIAPRALRVLVGRTGREIVRMPLGEAEQRYGAPYWIIHRGDLQAALVAAVAQERDISLKLGMRVEDFATHAHGVTVSASGAGGVWHEHGHALLAADGLWSAVARADRLQGPAAFCRPHRVARAHPGERSAAGIARTADPSLARARRPSGALSGQGRRHDQCRRHYDR